MIQTVTTEAGDSIQVRRMGLFEINEIEQPHLRPYTYTVVGVTGKEFVVEYDTSMYEEAPERPTCDKLTAKKGSDCWHKWREYDIFRAALAHQSRQFADLIKYKRAVAEYILRNCLVNPEDITKIISLADWDEIMKAALVGQVTQEMIQASLRDDFGASWGGKEIFDALKEYAEGGHGEFKALPVWETEMMIAHNMTEEEYITLEPRERARKIVANKLPDWMETLESALAARNMKAKHG
jgi:hypothetical protein